MDLSDLPEELVEEIASYLDFDDLCSCLKVSNCWRDALNRNRIWKRFVSYHPSYFIKQNRKVKYNELKDICHKDCELKKQAFIELSVKNNFLNGYYIMEKIDYSSFYLDNVYDAVDNMGNHWLFVSCMDGNDFEAEHQLHVWNMNNDPRLHESVINPLNKINRVLDSKLAMAGDKVFLVLEDTTFLIYEFSHPLYQLKLINKVVFEPVVSENLPISLIKKALSIAGNLVVGVLFTCFHADLNLPPSVYVWNGEGSLIFEECSLNNLSVSNDIDVSKYQPVLHVSSAINTSKIAITTQRKRTDAPIIIRIFDSLLLKYTDFFMQVQGQFFFQKLCGNILALYCFETSTPAYKLTFYNIVSGDKVGLFHYYSPPRVGAIDVEFIQSSGEVMVLLPNSWVQIDIHSQKKTESYFSKTIKDSCVMLINHSFLVTHIEDRNFYKILGIWDCKTNRKLYEVYCNFNNVVGNNLTFSCSQACVFPAKVFIFINPYSNYSSHVKDNKIVVCNFW